MQGNDDGERFHYYELSGIVERGTHFYLDTETQIAVLIDGNTEPPQLLEAQKFTEGEFDMLHLLLDNIPHYTSHCDLFATFRLMSPQRARRVLDDAIAAGNWDNTMRGVRNIISRLRVKLRYFGIDAVNLMETGYILIPRRRLE